MKRFRIAGIIGVAVCMLGLCSACGKESEAQNAETEETEIVSESDSEEDYPQIAYIENEAYYGTDEICEMVPRKAVDGVIETYVPKEIMPDAHNSANFGSEEEPVEYMFLEDGQLIVHIGENWYYFEKGVSE